VTRHNRARRPAMFASLARRRIVGSSAGAGVALVGEVLDGYRYRTTAGRTEGDAMCLGGGGNSARAASGSQGMAGAMLLGSNADALAREDLVKLYVGATRKNRVSL
jgi:hypothetical protein